MMKHMYGYVRNRDLRKVKCGILELGPEELRQRKVKNLTQEHTTIRGRARIELR